jgi:DNA-binding NarL/FixJ family response regulator
MDKIEIILVDDHNIVRDGIKNLLISDASFAVTGEASNYDELLDLLKYSVPDVILLDISLPKKSGIEITKEIVKKYTDINIIILSMYTEEEFVLNAVKAGAKGYLPKNTTKKELIDTVKSVASGKESFSDKISGVLMKSYLKSLRKSESSNNENAELSKREKEVLKLCAEGFSNQEISEKLFISVRTVESHKNHIMQKRNLKSSVDMIKYAIKSGLVEL